MTRHMVTSNHPSCHPQLPASSQLVPEHFPSSPTFIVPSNLATRSRRIEYPFRLLRMSSTSISSLATSSHSVCSSVGQVPHTPKRRRAHARNQSTSTTGSGGTPRLARPARPENSLPREVFETRFENPFKAISRGFGQKQERGTFASGSYRARLSPILAVTVIISSGRRQPKHAQRRRPSSTSTSAGVATAEERQPPSHALLAPPYLHPNQIRRRR